MNNVLIIDDEAQIRKLLAKLIELEGFDVMQAESCSAARSQLQRIVPDVILCDVRLRDGNGIDFLSEIKRSAPESEVILLTAYGNIPDSVRAMKNGAFDYITKGDDNDKIIPLLKRAVERVKAKKLSKNAPFSREAFDGIIGTSKAMTDAISLAKKISATNVPVLLTGETGTGKEVFAKAIHDAGLRKSKSFLPVNCSAFGKDLFESELFGYKAGAFTGALKNKKGLLEEADGGTIFFDEIGEMPLELQAKLLRVLESGEFIKVGDTKPSKVDIRIISATNRDLTEEIDAGRFRLDLFFRLSVFQILLPPLRERLDDIPEYVNHFVHAFSEKLGKKIESIDSRYIDALKSQKWMGNVRELRNVVERSIIMSNGGELSLETLPLTYVKAESQIDGESMGISSPISDLSLEEIEKNHIKKMLEFTGGNKTEAAKKLGIGVATLYRKMSEYNI